MGDIGNPFFSHGIVNAGGRAMCVCVFTSVYSPQFIYYLDLFADEKESILKIAGREIVVVYVRFILYTVHTHKYKVAINDSHKLWICTLTFAFDDVIFILY